VRVAETRWGERGTVVPIFLRETAGIGRIREPVAVGVPFPRGRVACDSMIGMRKGDGAPVSLQVRTLDRWSDRSVKWALLEFFASVGAGMTEAYEVSCSDPPCGEAVEGIRIRKEREHLDIDTGEAAFRLDAARFLPFSSVRAEGATILREADCRTSILDASGVEHEPRIESIEVEHSGPLTATVSVRGFFAPVSGVRYCDFLSRVTFYRGLSVTRIDFTIRNSRAAKHRGGMWDLGDEGSIHFRDLAMRFRIGSTPDCRITWTPEPGEPEKSAVARSFGIYQDSSGGKNWKSPNHVDRYGNVTNAFRGYRISLDDRLVLEGERASPVLSVDRGDARVIVCLPYFWQNFPKALDVRDGELFVRLFPGQHRGDYELQGGEQKTHTIYLGYEGGKDRDGRRLHWVHDPLRPVVSPEWMAETEVFPYLVRAANDPNRTYNALMADVVEGDRSFFARREIIDEYGWRNFGDLYADHETQYYEGEKPLISHYNNQYDGICGAILQYARSGDARWFGLAAEMARHVIDIDVYHTVRDKSAYNEGLFWHTDHYATAGTATHRTYSRRTKDAKGAGSYGGGPSNEHLYTTGLLYYHLLTGDPQARETVIALAQWVLKMEDGNKTPFRWLARGPTGLASQTASRDYHGPGRGSGNAINALIDAHVLTKDGMYLDFAGELIRRCIHPMDDVIGMNLMDHEARWSYTAFLQTLGKFLDLKLDLGEQDFLFCYARASLLHYADWMVGNEVPFRLCLDRVAYPTETWIVHDLRKSNVLEFAARYAGTGARDRFLEKAAFFYEGCFRDLQEFETRTCTRPLVMMMTYGIMHSRFQSDPETCADLRPQCHDFGKPRTFRPQRSVAMARAAAIAAGGALLLAAFLLLALAS
jgi:hypothetical protein